MIGNEFAELVWENGELLIRGSCSSAGTRSAQPSPSCARYFTETKRKDGDRKITTNSSFSNSKNLYNSASSQRKRSERNSCFESLLLTRSYETSMKTPSVHESRFSIKKDCDSIMEPHLIFREPGDAYGNTSRIEGDSQTPTGRECGNLCKSVLRDSSKDERTSKDYVNSKENNRKLDITSFFHFLKPAANVSGSGHGEPDLPTNQRDSSYAEKLMNKDIKVSTSRGSCLLVESTVNRTRDKPSLEGAQIDLQQLEVKIDLPPDQQSSAVGIPADSFKCSRGASNNPDITATRNYQKTGDQSEFHSNCDGESENADISAPARGKIVVKRKRVAKVHSLSEKRRREKINKRLRTLQALIPNCRKADKTSVLDEAIEYLKTLQLQLQIMSISAGQYMPPQMILLPRLMQQLQTSTLAYCPTMDTASVLRNMGMGTGCSGALQFPTLPISGAVAPNLRDPINLQMLGLPSSVATTPMTDLPPLVHPLTRVSTALKPETKDNIMTSVSMDSSFPENVYFQQLK